MATSDLMHLDLVKLQSRDIKVTDFSFHLKLMNGYFLNFSETNKDIG